MLTSDLAMNWRRGNAVGPRYIDSDSENHLETARGLVDVFESNIGRRRRGLDKALDEFIGHGTDYRVLRGLIKLLMDRCTFEVESSIDPFELRKSVFRHTRGHHPLPGAGAARDRILAEIGVLLGEDPAVVEGSLFADLPHNQVLTGFEELDARDLLDSYNVAQAQALLYRCVRMLVRASSRPPTAFRELFDAIKASRLIYEIRSDDAGGYVIELTGPVSMFHRSQKYGIQMAVFLPSLLRFDDWTMRAEIDLKSRGTGFFELTSRQNRLRPPDRDVTTWQHPVVEKVRNAIERFDDGWTAQRCREVLDLGETAFVPDAVLKKDESVHVYFEVLGFWTPRYLHRRLDELRRARISNFVLAISEELLSSRDELTETPPNVLRFRSTPDRASIRSVLDGVAG